MIATFFPFGSFLNTLSLQVSFLSFSTAKRLISLIAIGLFRCVLLQPDSQTCEQMQPREWGNVSFSLMTETASLYLPCSTSLIYIGISVCAGHSFLHGTNAIFRGASLEKTPFTSCIAPVGQTSTQAPQNLHSVSVKGLSPFVLI